MHKQTELIFVYNANASVFSQAVDYVHKIISPQTYECNLCKLTYDNLGMKKKWKQFVENLPYSITFLHKNELAKKFPQFARIQLPAVFTKHGTQLTPLITAEEINKQRTIPELEGLVRGKLP